MDSPINDFLIGYIQGAKCSADVKVVTSYVEAYDNPAKGKEMCLAQYAMEQILGLP